jgi:Ca2+-binding EF-hand superfamily protein
MIRARIAAVVAQRREAAEQQRMQTAELKRKGQRGLRATVLLDTHKELLESMTPEQFEALHEKFLEYGVSRPGFLTVKELGPLLRAVGDNPRTHELIDLISWVENPVLDFEELAVLLAIRAQHRHSPEEVIDAFRLFDPERSGAVPVSVFREAMQHLAGITDAELDDLVQEALAISRQEANRRRDLEAARAAKVAARQARRRARMAATTLFSAGAGSPPSAPASRVGGVGGDREHVTVPVESDTTAGAGTDGLRHGHALSLSASSALETRLHARRTGSLGIGPASAAAAMPRTPQPLQGSSHGAAVGGDIAEVAAFPVAADGAIPSVAYHADVRTDASAGSSALMTTGSVDVRHEGHVRPRAPAALAGAASDDGIKEAGGGDAHKGDVSVDPVAALFAAAIDAESSGLTTTGSSDVGGAVPRHGSLRKNGPQLDGLARCRAPDATSREMGRESGFAAPVVPVLRIALPAGEQKAPVKSSHGAPLSSAGAGESAADGDEGSQLVYYETFVRVMFSY